jgi:hypothetical protein
MGNQIVRFVRYILGSSSCRASGVLVVFIAVLYAISIAANALIAVGAPGMVAWGGAIVLGIAVMAGAVIGWQRLRLSRE